jgi:hypothetical protein
MTSAINPNNIDGSYPVPGVPNNTQGFRTNFTETKTNFQYAADEITDLQTNAILKAALTGTTLDNNMNGGLIYDVKLQDVGYTYLPVVATAGSIDINYSAAQFQQINPSAPVSLVFTNWPVTGTAGVVRLEFNITNVSQTLTLPAAVTLGTNGIQGYASSVITFADTGVYQFEFTSVNAGTTITIEDLTRPLLGTTESAVGYATGTGGAVTQATNKSTGVTLNNRCGQITMNNAALAAAAEVSFTLTNSFVAAADVVVICIASGATAGAYNVQVDAVAAGSCRISLGNMNASSRSEAVVLNFVVIKGAVS